MIAPAYLLAALIGATLVTLGAGGSIVTMPVLVYAAGLDVHSAVGTSLLVVGLIAVGGALLRRRSIAFRTGLLFGGAGMLGTGPGVWLNHQLPERAILAGFAGIMVAVAGMMARGGRGAVVELEPCAYRAAAVGFVVGIATGFFGVGGGFLIVPALVILLGVEISTAVATSLLVIALNSGAALIGHGAYGAVDWQVGLTLASAALAGAALAFPIAKQISGESLQRALAALIAIVGVSIAVDTLRQVMS